MPVLHRDRYSSWTRSPTKTESQACLQYAMWTLAASLASQPAELREMLYQRTLRLLESLESRDETLLVLEHIQARLLVCIYEFMRKPYQRGWLSAGRCYRSLQLSRLDELDAPEHAAIRESASESDQWIAEEEKRRTFWMAYSLDLFLGLRGRSPFSFYEYSVLSTLGISVSIAPLP